jgi:hypothetical protein
MNVASDWHESGPFLFPQVLACRLHILCRTVPIRMISRSDINEETLAENAGKTLI